MGNRINIRKIDDFLNQLNSYLYLYLYLFAIELCYNINFPFSISPCSQNAETL